MSDLIGQTIGGYRVVDQIGRGGMATVYKAYQPSLERYVAIKVLPPYYVQQDETFLTRFKREARAIASLRHPNILIVLEHGEHEGMTYLVMEYVDAGTLTEVLGKPMPLPAIAKILEQVAAALDYAHEQGVIHRDVKPSNILLPKPDWPLLTDFGLAKIVGGSRLTQTGAIAGTPAYMSPEQGRGDAVDARSDIYSLGIVLYEMATGVVPFSAETPMAVVVKHIIEPLPLPRAKNPDLPESVERVILKALAKDPTDRYARAGELGKAIDETLQQETVADAGSAAVVSPHPAETQTRPQEDTSSETVGEDAAAATRVAEAPTPRVGIRRFVPSRRPWLVIPLTFVALLAVGMVVWGSWDGAPMPPLTAVQPAEARTVEQMIADGRAAFQLGDLETAIADFEAALARDPENVELYFELAVAYDASGQHDKARDSVQAGIDHGTGEAWVHESAGLAYQELGLYTEAASQFEAAVEQDRDAPWLYEAVIDAYLAAGDPQAASEWLGLTLAAPGAQDGEVLESIGWSFLEHALIDEAEVAFLRAIEVGAVTGDPWAGLAQVAYERDDLQGAIETLEEGLRQFPEDGDLHESLGWAYWERGEVDAAESAFRAAVEHGPDNPSAFGGLAGVLVDMGKAGEAEALLLAAVADHNQDPAFHETLASFYAEAGRPEEAIGVLEQAVARNPQSGWLRAELASALVQAGRSEAALGALDEAASLNDGDAWLAGRIGWLYSELRRCDMAIPQFELALELDPTLVDAEDGLRQCGG